MLKTYALRSYQLTCKNLSPFLTGLTDITQYSTNRKYLGTTFFHR